MRTEPWAFPDGSALQRVCCRHRGSEYERKEDSTMRNNYETAEIVEIGRAQDVILGNKVSDPESFDTRTQQLGSLVIDELTD